MTDTKTFEEVAMPHLGAAYNLARWMVKDAAEAEDIVQEAYLRAWKGFPGFRGGDGRAWMLTIVRNACYTWFQKNGRHEAVEFEEELHCRPAESSETEGAFRQLDAREALNQAMRELPVEYREALVLRELEGLSYKQISEVAGVPVGTVMSRLARARKRMKVFLDRRARMEGLDAVR